MNCGGAKEKTRAGTASNDRLNRNQQHINSHHINAPIYCSHTISNSTQITCQFDGIFNQAEVQSIGDYYFSLSSCWSCQCRCWPRGLGAPCPRVPSRRLRCPLFRCCWSRPYYVAASAARATATAMPNLDVWPFPIIPSPVLSTT
jgi:hypothetical protein